MSKQKSRSGLGRGLNALINTTASGNENVVENSEINKSGVIEVELNKIEPNNNQPRKYFDDEGLQELAESIKSFGIIQPLIVKDCGKFYSIIAGERRWRAARLAGITKIPVIIKEYNEMETIQIALIENIQREDLNPIEEAMCYKKLSEEFFLSQEDIANRVGKKRGSISYYINLLNLDNRVQSFISNTKISAGHGRALLSIKDFENQFIICEYTIENNLSVKDLEIYVNRFNEELENPELNKGEEQEKVLNLPKLSEKNSIFKKIEKDLKSVFGTKVTIKSGKKKGKIEIEYYSEDELDRLVSLMKNIE